jgi:hypothetical protein
VVIGCDLVECPHPTAVLFSFLPHFVFSKGSYFIRRKYTVAVFLNFIIGAVDLRKSLYKIGSSKGNLQFA